MGKADKLDTIVQRSPTNENNTESLRIEEESLESVFSKIFEELNSSERMNLANSLGIESPKLVHFGHPPMETNHGGNLIDGILATRIDHSNRIWRLTDRDDMMAHTHDVETMSNVTAYSNHIKNSEIETRNVFERETSNENIENIVTQLDKTRLDNNQMTQSTDSSKHRKTYELGSNPDPEPSSSDSSESLSLESRARKKNRTKKKKHRKYQKDDLSDPSSSDDSYSSNDSHYRRKRHKNKKHRKKYLIRLCTTLTEKLLKAAYK